MEFAFSKVLGKKITYRKPLFLIDLDLREQEVKKGGGWQDNNRTSGILDYRNIVKNDDVRLRLNHGLRNVSPNGILMLRQIFLARSIYYDALEKYVDFDQAVDTTLDVSANEILGNYQVRSEFGKDAPNKFIIRMQGINTTTKHAEEFIRAWADLMYRITHMRHELPSLEDMNQRASKQGYRLIEQHTPRTTPENNPLFITFLLYEKNHNKS